MTWHYKGNIVDEIPEGVIGFVYLITNNTNNKNTQAKTGPVQKTRPPLKGKKRKRRTTVESDWRDYWGSSDHLNADVENLGPRKFYQANTFTICKSKGELSYLEAQEQFKRKVLLTERILQRHYKRKSWQF